MNNNEIEAKMRRAFAAVTPNGFDSVLSDCKKGKGKVIPMEEKKTNVKGRGRTLRIAGIAAAAAVLLVAAGIAIGGLLFNGRAGRVAAVVALDVNPGIEIDVNGSEEVLAVRPLNGDAEKVIGTMELKGSSLDVAVNALIGSMLRNGYINELANSILISVDGANGTDTAALQSRLSREINALLQANALNGAVLSQVVNGGDELRSLADSFGITVGKAQLINLIIANDSRYTFESLVPLTINQLNLLCEQFHTGMNGVDFVGHASDAAYIGAEAAKQAATAHSGVAPESVTRIVCELDWDDGRMVYEVEFASDGTEYEYDIDAETGSVLKFESGPDEHAPGAPTQAPDPSLYIGEDEALRIALGHAGVNESDVTRIRIKLEQDDGILLYDVKFYAGDYEYDYEIDALSGSILDYDKEWEGGGFPAGTTAVPTTNAPATNAPATNAPSTNAPATNVPATNAPATNPPAAGTANPTQPRYIGEDAAKRAALGHAGYTEAQVSGLRAKFDIENGRAVYDVEFYANGYEYDYEIDAVTGGIIKFDREREGGAQPTQAHAQPTQAPAQPTQAPQQPSQYIGKERAKQTALDHAGCTEAQTSYLTVEFDYDDGRAVYDVEFYANGYEYDYKIDARTGSIIHYERERDEHGGNGGSPTERPAEAGYIGEDAAKRIAFGHAGVKESDVRGLEIELESEHGIMVYKVEFKSGYKEYDYEINAVTGDIIEFDIDADD